MAKKRPTRPTRRPSGPKPTGRGGGPTAVDGVARRKEQTRREREAALRQREARRRTRRLFLIGGVLVVVLGAYLYITFKKTPSSTDPAVYASVGQNVNPDTLPGIRTGPAPWSSGQGQLQARLQAIGLQALGSQGSALHIHQHLDIYVDGAKVTVPADIGIGPTFLSAIHTHDTSGVVHVESPTQRAYTLGEFFDVWGVRFTATCLGGYCEGGGKTLRVYVDGHLATGSIRQIRLLSHEQIAVVYGAPSDGPNSIPAKYGFPFGY